MEYVTVDEARAELGEELADKTDAAVLRMIDRTVEAMETALGHTFGRALIARSTDADHTVRVTTDALIIGGDSYAFADYATLGALMDAVNGAGAAYALDLLPNVEPRTPSTSLAARAEVVCGGGYENRQVLDATHLYVAISGRYTSAIYLPLPAYEIVEIVEDGTELEETAYAIDAERIAIWRRGCMCTVFPCSRHNAGRWSTASPENIRVLYIPRWWRRPPAACAGVILEALAAMVGGGPFESETFGPYSYRRKLPVAESWRQIVSSPSLNQYRTRLVVAY